MADKKKYSENSEAIQAHLRIYQTVIQRMSTNSASAKAWCITLDSAILVLLADKGKPDHAWIAIIPAILFFVLDGYYLALEKAFRNSYNKFIDKLCLRKIEPSDLYAVIPTGSILKHFLKSILSFSVWPFYLTLIILIYFIGIYLL